MMRFQVFNASVHGGKLLGESDDLEKAINIGAVCGCTKPGCLCERYTIYDKKLKTNEIDLMFVDQQREEILQRIEKKKMQSMYI